MAERFAVVGAGKVGSALARLLSRAGHEFLGAADTRPDAARAACEFAGEGTPSADAPSLTRRAELVFITTPDGQIEPACDEIARQGGFVEGTVVAHCSGALPSSVLRGARLAGARVGSLHPLQAFATAEQAVKLLPGSYCCIEGDEEAVEVLERVAEALGARPLSIATEAKPLYHAVAVLASNYLVGLEHAALKAAQAAGLDRAEALRALMPLIKGTVSNLEAVGIPDALTGPIARGDVETVRGHIAALEARLPALAPVYKLLGRETLEVARSKGTLAPQRAEELARLLAEP